MRMDRWKRFELFKIQVADWISGGFFHVTFLTFDLKTLRYFFSGLKGSWNWIGISSEGFFKKG